MYREHVMDHYKHPRNYGVLASPSIVHTEKNPSCGDTITIMLRLEKDIIQEAMFTGGGCAISIAATSMLLEELRGKTVAEAAVIDKEELLEQLPELSTMRVKCGLLGLHALKKALIGGSHASSE